ncbi:MAG: DnaJ domain-containing protein [Candidatus Nitrohelix vancouverensis]|uniref:DnaJ domain-containing protein n=1 Tax=Candidatus Nitrohelix vancouverensis TaxID=2705534 RepID=A0A7T0C326_9BACT|nr:MAG: DnaJ domain-containing protein [Candidatus Nitrohelix vancouverensis]
MRYRPKEFKDYYQLLKIEETSSEAEIKKSYRKLALEFHPDQNKGDPSCEEKFKEITEAYGVLSDPAKRSEYDRFRRDYLAGRGTGDSGFNYSQEEIFENMFKNGFSRDMFEELNREFQKQGYRSGQNFFGPILFGNALGGLGRILGMIPGPIGKIGHALRLAQMIGTSILTYQNMRKSRAPQDGNPSEEAPAAKVFDKLKKNFLNKDAGSLNINFAIEIAPDEALNGAQKKISFKNDGALESVLVKIPPKFTPGGKLRLRGKGKSEQGQRGDLILTVNVSPA